MPKVSWAKPKPNYLRCLLTEYRKAKHMTYSDLAKLLGCSAQNCVQQICKKPEMWRIGDLKLYCEALGVPIEEAVLAAVRK